MNNSPVRPQRLLLTGGTGFIGGELLKLLLARGHFVLALVRPPEAEERLRWRLRQGPQAPLRGDLRIVPGDITLPGFGLDRAARQNLRALDHVVHAAGLTAFAAGRREELLRLNHRGALNAARMARDQEARRLILVSTAFLGGRSGRLVKEGPLAPLQDPQNPYEEAKALAEQDAAALLAGSQTRLLVLRPSIVVNDGPTGFALNREHLYAFWRPLRRLSRCAREGTQEFRVRANPDGTKNMIPVDRVAAALLGLVEKPGVTGFINCIHDQPLPHARLLEMAQKTMGVSGIRMVSQDLWAKRPPSRLETLLDAALAPYRTYLEQPEPPMAGERLKALLKSWSPGAALDQPFLGRAFQGFEQLALPPTRLCPNARALLKNYRQHHLLPLQGRRLIPGIGELDAAFGVLVAGAPPGKLGISIKNGALSTVDANLRGPVLFRMESQVFLDVVTGSATPVDEFLAGRIDIEGAIEEGLKLVGLLSDFFRLHPYTTHRSIP